MKRMWGFLKDYRKECVLGPLFKLMEALLELLVPLVVKAMIDRGVGTGSRSFVLQCCGLLILLAAVGLAFSVTAQFFAAKAATGCAAKMRQVLFSHLQTLSYTEIDRLGTSAMITRMTSDIGQVQSGVNLALRLLLRSPFVVFGAMIMAFTIDIPAAIIFAVVIPVLSVIVTAVILTTIPMHRKVQACMDRLTGITRENLNGVRVLRAFGKEQEETERFGGVNGELYTMQMKVGRISNLLNPVTYVLLNMAVIVLLHTGAVRVHMGALTQGQVVALFNYMSQILVELIKFANLIVNITKAAACGSRIFQTLDIVPSQKPGMLKIQEENEKGTVEFQNVSLSYTDQSGAALTDISFTAHSGQVIGIIGGTGAGKTTLVNLIPRFYDADRGRVLVDGVDVTSLDPAELRKRIGIVPQKAVLFRGTIRSNLLWGKEDSTEDEMKKALETAQAMDIVKNGPDGLDSPVEQGGRNLSGGQKQRITIARALIREPEILILDDSASALDYATDAALRRAIHTMKNAPTTFIVSQRAASVLYADRILVLDDGVLTGNGTHEELLKHCQVYQEIYYSQFPREVTES